MANSPDRSPVDDSIDPDKEARMLLNPPNDSVQFTSNSSVRDPTNGQVLLSPIGSGPNSTIRNGVGMTKQELMKYANDPFWVRLRTFLFILFWVVWFAMLIGSIVIVAMAPSCPATASLPWWKKSSMMEINVDYLEEPNRIKYAQWIMNVLDEIKSNLDTLAYMNVDTILVNAFDPYILIPVTSDNNATKDEINKLRNKITSLVKNEKEIKLIMGLRLEQTPDSFHWFNKSKNNQSGYEDVYIWLTNKPKTEKYKYEVDRYKYVATDIRNNPLLNYASPKVRNLIRDSVLAWMKTKIEGIKTDFIRIQNQEDEKISVSKEAESDILKLVKSAGQNKVFLVTDPNLIEDGTTFKTEEEKSSFDMNLNMKFWQRFTESPLKESLDNLFLPYIEQEQEAMKDNQTDSDKLVTRENVGKYWRTYIIQHPSDPMNRILSNSNLSMAEGAIMAFYMMPRVTPVINIQLNNLESLNNKSKVVDRMLKLRHENPETFLAGRIVLPQVNGSNMVFAIYRGAKHENGYLLLINLSEVEQIISVDSGHLPYQNEVVSRRVILVDSDSSKDSIGIDINMEHIEIDPKQVMLIEFSVK